MAARAGGDKPEDGLVALTTEGDNPLMPGTGRTQGRARAAWLAGLCALASLAAAADEPVPHGVAGAAAGFIRDAAASERTALWGWTTVALGGGAYSGLALGGRDPGPEWLASLAVVGTVAGLVGAGRSWWRARELAALAARLDPDAAGSAWSATAALDRETRLAFERELWGTRRRLAAASRGALRAGCVLPVLLGGIGAYGLLAGRGGEELAGISVGGALVIGVPSVLTYWGLNERLRRVDALARQWTDALPGQGGAPAPQ